MSLKSIPSINKKLSLTHIFGIRTMLSKTNRISIEVLLSIPSSSSFRIQLPVLLHLKFASFSSSSKFALPFPVVPFIFGAFDVLVVVILIYSFGNFLSISSCSFGMLLHFSLLMGTINMTRTFGIVKHQHQWQQKQFIYGYEAKWNKKINGLFRTHKRTCFILTTTTNTSKYKCFNSKLYINRHHPMSLCHQCDINQMRKLKRLTELKEKWENRSENIDWKQTIKHYDSMGTIANFQTWNQ